MGGEELVCCGDGGESASDGVETGEGGVCI